MVICGLYYGREIVIPLAIAFLIAFALNPPDHHYIDQQLVGSVKLSVNASEAVKQETEQSGQKA